MNDELVLKRRKWVIFGGLAIFIVILMVSLGFLIYGRIFSARLNIMVAPYTAKVRVGEMEFTAFLNDIKMQPGEYAVEVSAEGFKTKTGRLVLEADETAEVKLYLEPDAEATLNWYEENASDALIVGEIENEEMLKKVDDLIKKEPAFKNLPFTVEYYSDDLSEYTKYVVSYELDNSERGFFLIVKDYTGVGRDTAITKLTEMGMNTAGVEIKYENLEGDTMSGYAE